MAPIPEASANSPTSSLQFSSSASVFVLPFLTTDVAVEGGVGGGGLVLVVVEAVVPGVGYRIRYAAPSPAGKAPVRNGIDDGDANANKDGGGAVVRSVSGDGGGGFYSNGEEKYYGNGGGGSGWAEWGVS